MSKVGKEVMAKVLNKEPIEKLEIDLMDKTDDDYTRARAEHIKDWVNAGKSKAWAEADFDSKYPSKQSWNAKTVSLNGWGEQQLIDKINEIIDYINE